MRVRALLAAGVALTLLGSACSGGDDERSPSGAGATITDRVTYLTAASQNGRESYAHVAKAKGYFADEGIDVDIQVGNTGEDNDAKVSAGTVQFAAVDASGVIKRAAETTPEDRKVTAVAAVHQRTLLALVTLADRGITTPGDLNGRTIGLPKLAAVQLLFPLYAKLAQKPQVRPRWVDQAVPQLPTLLVGNRIDLAGLFVAGVPGVAAAEQKVADAQKREPRKIVTLPYSDFITDLYGNVIITSRALADSNPDLVRRFVRALMKGLEYALGHPEEAGKILYAQVRSQDPNVAAAELTAMDSYSRPPGGKPWGYIDQERLNRCIAIMHSLPMPLIAPDQVVRFDLVPS